MEHRTGRRIAVLAIGLAAVLAFPWNAVAAGFAPATVEYSADRHMSSGSREDLVGKVYSAPGKERDEFGQGMVSIIRMDKKLIWTLMPSDRKYMEHRFGEAQGKRQAGDYRDCDVKQKGAGEEVVNGFRTKKSTIEVSCPDDKKYSGTIWLTKDNILMRMESVAESGKSKKEKFRMELRNLKIGKLDPALFEIPAGYQKFELPNMGDFQRMMKQQAVERPAPRESSPEETVKPAEAGRSDAAQPEERSTLDQGMDKAKKLKNLLGW